MTNRYKNAYKEIDKLKKLKINIPLDNTRNALITNDAYNIITDVYEFTKDNIQELFSELAKEFSYDEKHALRMYYYISNLMFIPSSPVFRNVLYPNNHKVISCFTNTMKHTRHAITRDLDTVIQQLGFGGGVSIDLSKCPHVRASKGKYLPSDVSKYINLIENVLDITRLNGKRNANIAYYLKISHPDIFEFCEVRKATFDNYKAKISRSHIAVIITDDFMNAVINNLDFDLICSINSTVVSTIKARKLWKHIILCRIETGEPYIYFEGNVERNKAKAFIKNDIKIGLSNLCTEIALPSKGDRGGVCCLGSINLEKFKDAVKYANENGSEFIYDCLLFLNMIHDKYVIDSEDIQPLERTINGTKRAIAVGLGVAGLHSYMQSKELYIDNKDHWKDVLDIFRKIKTSADIASEKLGDLLGHAPDNIEAGIKGRFTCKLAIAPTVHISHIMNISEGINLMMSNIYSLRTTRGNSLFCNKIFIDHINKLNFSDEEIEAIKEECILNRGSVQNIKYLNDHTKKIFKTAYEVCQKTFVTLIAAIQEIYANEQSISLNLHFDENASLKIINEVHIHAYNSNIKTLYYFKGAPAIITTENNKITCLGCD